MSNLKPSTRLLIRTFIYCFFISFIFLLFTSNNSFLYEKKYYYDNYLMNSMFNNSFMLFILELISNTLLLFFSYKIYRLFLSKYASKLLIPIIMVSLTTCEVFGYGGSPVEFVLSLSVIGLYFYLRHFKRKMLDMKEMFLCGILSGLTFVIDYYLFGIWIGFGIVLLLDYIINRHQKKNGIKRFTIYLIGILLVVGLVFLREYLFNDINEYLNIYFVDKFCFHMKGFINNFLTNLWSLGVINYWIIIVGSIMLFRLNINTFSKIGLIIMALLLVIGFSINYLDNNILIMMSYYVLGLLGIYTLLDNWLLDFNKYYYKFLIVIITIICFLLNIYGANHLDDMKLLNNYVIVFKK